MERPIPMDRLVCGDVGYGKTEVALRAAFKAVQDGKQVAVLVPTTLLASQHGQTFRERFANYPVRVEVLSRFLTAKEQARRSSTGVRDGAVDVVIGTHRLLSDDIKFKDLGLLVVDEEQRFGVQHKERIKQLRDQRRRAHAHRHADPAHARDVAHRHPRPVARATRRPRTASRSSPTSASTTTAPSSEAIRRELLREGQVFFVHNRVQRHRARRRATCASSCPRRASRSRTGRWTRAASSRSCSTSGSASTTCSCARRSSRAASTCRR